MFVFVLILVPVVCESAKDDFLMNTSQCTMPRYPAFSSDTTSIYNKLPYRKCSDLDLLTYTEVLNNRAYLHINTSNLDQYYTSIDKIDCCLRHVHRNGTEDEPDVGISATSCKAFQATSVALEHDTVIVNCYIGADKIYSNVHRPIIVTDKIKRKLKFSNDRKLSVLQIVIDSVSRLNLERTMPLTRDYLLMNDFIEFEGYNKIDDNTYPNFNALLTGLNFDESNARCRPETVGGLDQCPMIWYDFRAAGYVTAYAEDWAQLNTYNYLKKGFKDAPTDYYFKPYFEAAELDYTYLDTMPYCAGPVTQGERTLGLAKDFVTTFRNYPTFGIFWMNTFSHNDINSPTRMDEKVKDFFGVLKARGIFNESIVYLLSDHGMRTGPIRNTLQGWHEERTPVHLVSVPPWFQEKFPVEYGNLKKNSKRLTSTYDLYMTLQDILAMNSHNYTVTNSRACPTCLSLFSEVPEDRSCRQAGIPEMWCTCLGKFEKDDKDITEGLKHAAVEAAKAHEADVSRHHVRSIIVSAISRGTNSRKYFLIVFETRRFVRYQALFRLSGQPLQLGKLVRLSRLY